MKLRMASTTQRFVEAQGSSSAHALLLTGPIGIGLATLAAHLAKRGGRILTVVAPEAKTSKSLAAISVERVRQLYVETRARLDGDHFVIIDDADAMNHAAQNALLKLLEEPNPSIRFILTSHAPDKLLPTIRSRAQTFAVPSIDAVESRRLLKSLGVTDRTDEQRLLYVAEGLPAELHRLSQNESDFRALSERVRTARQFIEGTAYQRLTLTLMLGEDRKGALSLIETIVLLLKRSLVSAPDRQTAALIDRLVDASDAIRVNGHIRLHLSAAVVQ